VACERGDMVWEVFFMDYFDMNQMCTVFWAIFLALTYGWVQYFVPWLHCVSKGLFGWTRIN
jgi:hypothetical protein